MIEGKKSASRFAPGRFFFVIIGNYRYIIICRSGDIYRFKVILCNRTMMYKAIHRQSDHSGVGTETD